MLRNVSEQDLSVTVLGHKMSMPICVAPTGYQAMAHPDGELATVRAVKSQDTAMGVSIFATTSLEDIAQECPHTIKFMQVQFFSDRHLMAQAVKRAEKAGYKAILLTVDTPVYSRRKSTGRRNFRVPNHLKCANFQSLQQEKGLRTNEEVDDFLSTICDGSVDWGTFDWLRSTTSLPFVLKGILTSEDARLAVQHGAQGIMVSNHGGRHLDGVSATIDVLPEIVEPYVELGSKFTWTVA